MEKSSKIEKAGVIFAFLAFLALLSASSPTVPAAPTGAATGSAALQTEKTDPEPNTRP